MIFSGEGLRHLVAEMVSASSRSGPDVPFNWPSTVNQILDAPFLSDADKEAILGGNASKWLRL
jgi:hypothetical protein